MADISSIDKNFKVETKIEKEGLKFYNALSEPFRIYGVFHDGERFRRVPEELGDKLGGWMKVLDKNTAGGRVRFRTNSPFIAINRKGQMDTMPHMAATGSSGFDLYFGTRYIKTFVPPVSSCDFFESIIETDNREMKEVTINFPLYSDVDELYIGLDENAVVEAPTPYRIEKPVVFYGSSITQGGCASRPGTCYQPYITRRFDCDHINLGFSGSARAEIEMAEYVASLDMSMFVYDYDHNAPTVEHLKETHERMYRIVRAKHPEIPIVMMSRPKFYLETDEEARVEIIKQTLENAKNAGDRNTYFIDGRDLCKYCGNEGTVDGCHPTDFGFASMGKVLCEFIEEHRLLKNTETVK